MLLVGLTGGIGSGKSSVGRLLAGHGAIVIDADELAREAIAPGTPGERQVLDRFGPRVATRGGVDRDALARIVFDDDAARRDLEGIVHPEVRRLFAERCAAVEDPHAVVVFEAPLLIETGLASAFDELIVVIAPEDVRVRRLQAGRAMGEAEARARMRSQVDDDARRAAASVVIENAGDDPDALGEMVAAVWQRLADRAGR